MVANKIQTVQIYPAANKVGIISSSICLIHCVFSPFLLLTGFQLFDFPWLKYLFITVAFISIFYSQKGGDHWKLYVIMWIGFWLFLFAMLFEESYPFLGYVGWFSSALIIYGHILNIRHCKKCITQKDFHHTIKPNDTIE